MIYVMIKQKISFFFNLQIYTNEDDNIHKNIKGAQIVRKRSQPAILPATENRAEELPNKDKEDLGEENVQERSVKTVATLFLHLIIVVT